MLSLGIMASRLRSEETYFTEIALAADKENVAIYIFCPDKVNTQSETITGEAYDYKNNKWTASQFPIPDFIYDRSFHGLVRQSEKVRYKINWLQNHSMFLGFGLPGKSEVHQFLSKIASLSRFHPPLKKVYETADIWKELNDHGKIMLKPEFGSRGIGIYLLSIKDGGWVVRMTKKEEGYARFFDNKTILNRWLTYLLEECPYVSQPYLELFNNEDEPFDIRILLQKDSENNWIERGRGVRVGRKHCITANLSAGARAFPFEKLLQAFPADLQPQISKSIQDIVNLLPRELETRFNRLFEIGVDLGIDKKGNVWLLDINSKPGRKIIELLHPEKMPELHKAPILYVRCLAEELSKAGV
ncbi:YheC/YheD family protein [Bacillus sp. V59.32b]|uniref:YheC/YheD family endospore coat-associated protein n=1 Tax=Bacillus sp. V59.32b TaxID=1758642 RepID=UPI000E3EC738|nr:YheC/YheD family protein [Bacillus sp. V59.32b]RFU64370.1 YheC/YheD family protein [Bacillus sp. V59.32b]